MPGSPVTIVETLGKCSTNETSQIDNDCKLFVMRLPHFYMSRLLRSMVRDRLEPVTDMGIITSSDVHQTTEI